ncbi:protease SohB [Rheinheimera marina]|uniref:Protease SohB n=1 Tax=Rheinheimera marina TaxID=1774958 RepID=A0ABV9JR30_9GAMM
MEFLYHYGLFLAKAVTIVLCVAFILILVVSSRQKGQKAGLEFTDLSADYKDQQLELQHQLLDKKAFKQWKKSQPEDKSNGADKQRLFVINFNGSMDAHEVGALREEVTAVLAVAKPSDEVLVRLESPGGVVHGYGLAASQLERLRQREIPLTVAVDKVAASGGYMMACIANTIIAAPFAIVGSIGVVAQLPNFHKLLKKNHIDVEQFTAGEFKRTVTVFAENTDKGRQKFQQELEQTHLLFKEFVARHRPVLDIDQVATGEHWFGYQAKELKLVDKLQTSDDYLLANYAEKHVVQVSFQTKAKLAERLGLAAAAAVHKAWLKLAQQTGWH